MTDLLISRDLSPVKRRAKLKALFFEMSRAGALDDKLRAVIDDFDAGVLSGEHWKATGWSWSARATRARRVRLTAP
jgi:hypothetical protein